MSNKTVAKNLPEHLAIIMDGNGRWAKKRGLPRIFGHRAGVKAVKKIVETCADLNIKILTLYAFSTENWARPASEVNSLMFLLRSYLRKELLNMNKNNIKLNTIGDINQLPEKARKELDFVISETKKNTGLILNLALNYGSRQELVMAINRIIGKGIKKVDENIITENLYTVGLSDPDLLIRTSGEMRVSNFMLWQIAYAELYITPVLWPDFSVEHLKMAFAEYKTRDRRFGGI